jgi:hypothetical protein
MTAYFDDRDRRISVEGKGLPDDRFLLLVEEVEAEVIHQVNLLTGDREFPEDLRERFQRCIANKRCKTLPGLPPTDARQYCLALRHSELLSYLHSLFHELAGRRIRTRHGLLFDSPVGFLRERGDLP